MFITAHYNAPMGVGDSQLVYERYEHSGYPVSDAVNIGNWRELSQWCAQLRGYIDEALVRQMFDAQVQPSQLEAIAALARQIRARALPEPLCERLASPDAVTLRLQSGFTRHLPWEAMALDGCPFGSGGFTLDPGAPQPPRHVSPGVALLILDPTGSFQQAPVAEHFERVREHVQAAGLDVLEVHGANYSIVREQLANPSLAMIYFFGHMDRADNGDGQLVLSEDERLTAREIADSLRPSANIVVLNGCDASGAAPSRYGLQTLNVAEAFARAGSQFVTGAAQRISWQTAIAADEQLVFPFLRGQLTAAATATHMRNTSIERFLRGEPDFGWAVVRVLANPTLDLSSALADSPVPATVDAQSWSGVSNDVLELISTPGVTDMRALQQRIARHMAPTLSNSAPRPQTTTQTTSDDDRISRYLAAFAERHPGGGIDALARDLIDQGQWDARGTGLSEPAVRLLLHHDALLASFAPVSTDARAILRRGW